MEYDDDAIRQPDKDDRHDVLCLLSYGITVSVNGDKHRNNLNDIIRWIKNNPHRIRD